MTQSNVPRIPLGGQTAAEQENDPNLVFVKQTTFSGISVIVYGIGKHLTIEQMLRALVKLANDAPLDQVEKLLREYKYPIPDAQVKDVLDKQAKFFLNQKGGENFGLHEESTACLILVLDDNGSVSVTNALWLGRQWDCYRDSLSGNRVYGGRHFVVSNSEPSNL